MGIKRITIQGFRIYDGVPLKEIVEDLKKHETVINKVLKELVDLRGRLTKQKDRLDDSTSVLEYIDYN